MQWQSTRILALAIRFGLRGWPKRYPLLSFFGSTFAFSYLVGLLVFASAAGISPTYDGLDQPIVLTDLLIWVVAFALASGTMGIDGLRPARRAEVSCVR